MFPAAADGGNRGERWGYFCHDSYDWDQPEEPTNSSKGSELSFLICSQQKLNIHTLSTTIHSVQVKDPKDMIFRMKIIGDWGIR